MRGTETHSCDPTVRVSPACLLGAHDRARVRCVTPCDNNDAIVYDNNKTYLTTEHPESCVRVLSDRLNCRHCLMRRWGWKRPGTSCSCFVVYNTPDRRRARGEVLRMHVDFGQLPSPPGGPPRRSYLENLMRTHEQPSTCHPLVSRCQ